MEQPSNESKMFAEAEPPRSFPGTAVGIAAVAMAILLAVLVMRARRPAVPVSSAGAAYAAQLELSGETMSEADSRDGFGKLIYIEGRVVNRGAATVSGVQVQVTFPADQPPAQVETVPLNTIYMREPYVDTRLVSAASPLAPGGSAEFRLILDDVKDSWNQQMPAMKIVSVSVR
jgi:hypothetical protein